MPKVPEIQYEAVTIADEYTQGYSSKRCKKGLWSIYQVIRKIHNHGAEDRLKALECLFAIGVQGQYDDRQLSLVYSGMVDKRYKRGMPASKYLFALEAVGFAFHDLVTDKKDTPRNKLAIKDIQKFRFTYQDEDFPDVIFGLKLFSEICMKQQGDCFYYGDIRVAFTDAPKLYAPPVDEVFYFLPDRQQEFAYVIHNKLEGIGCTRNLERENMTRYKHPLVKGKTLATIYAAKQLYFLSDSEHAQELVLNLNLRNIGQYSDYLSDCTETVQKTITEAQECYGCKKMCGGIRFAFQGKEYRKCPRSCFRFYDLSDAALDNYIALIGYESDSFKRERRYL